MACYRCGTRQVDPDRGESPWKRGVRGNTQVLICPGCQAAYDWTAELDRCPICSSVRLVRRLGEVECRECGCVREPAGVPAAPRLAGAAGIGGRGPDASPADGSQNPGLAEEVERALARVLGRGGRRAEIS